MSLCVITSLCFKVFFSVCFLLSLVRLGRVPDVDDSLVPLKEVARLLNITPKTARNLIKAGTFPLPVRPVGRKLQVPRKSLERFLSDDEAVA